MNPNVPQAAAVGEEVEEIKDTSEIEVYEEPEWRKDPIIFAQYKVKLAKHVDSEIKRCKQYRRKKSARTKKSAK